VLIEIETVPDSLGWGEERAALDAAHAYYVDHLGEALGWKLAEIRLVDPARGESLAAAARGLGDVGFLRFLTAPEVSRRLIWGGPAPSEVAEFFAGALAAEAAREGQEIHFRVETWTALGDEAFRADGSRHAWPRFDSMMPLDFGSPYAARIDLSGASDTAAEKRPPFEAAELELVHERLGRTFAAIAAAAPSAAWFAATFNKVLVLQKDPSAPDQLSSGSNGQYIGRSFLTNPERDHAREEDIADAVVHEAIHGLLYIHQTHAPWLRDRSLGDQATRVTSPWTGRGLPLHSFLEACFVWYGLLHFWCLALRAESFDPGRTRLFLKRALRGFLQDPLVGFVEAYRPGIEPAVIDALDLMQSRVRSAFGA
jgi:hypothetical protein